MERPFTYRSQSSSKSTALYAVAAVLVIIVLFVMLNNSDDRKWQWKKSVPAKVYLTSTTPLRTTKSPATTTTKAPLPRMTSTPAYITKQEHEQKHLRDQIDRELRELANQIIDPQNLAVPSRVRPRPAVIGKNKAVTVAVKNKPHVVAKHPAGCGCSICSLQLHKKRTPAPICATIQMPLGRINYDNYDAWKERPFPWWARPATRRMIDRPPYTAVPINWKMHPDHHHHHAKCGH